MLGIITILSFSWGTLHFIANRNLSVLGLRPTLKRLREFAYGLVLTAVLCTVCQLTEAYFSSTYWELNSTIKPENILAAIWWDFKSVLTEELFFRGAFLFLIIRKFGPRKGIMLSAVGFGIYHWFSMGLFGSIFPMTIVFIGTGLTGLTWAYAFQKSRSMALPFGMHIGWNMTFNTLFSKGPLGTLILIKNMEQELDGWFGLIYLLMWVLIVPLIMFFFVRFIVRENAD